MRNRRVHYKIVTIESIMCKRVRIVTTPCQMYPGPRMKMTTEKLDVTCPVCFAHCNRLDGIE